MQVVAGKKIMLLARRNGAEIRFSLRAGTGSPVARAPWKEEWGGGASVENPHFQRVHYCELLVRLVFCVNSGFVACCLQVGQPQPGPTMSVSVAPVHIALAAFVALL